MDRAVKSISANKMMSPDTVYDAIAMEQTAASVGKGTSDSLNATCHHHAEHKKSD